MSTNFPIPETKVLAIASHVSYGYVGNTMATFVMQSLGCDVAAINTVHFSNHTGYRQFTGHRHPASDLTDLYTGLTNSHLTDFTMLLSGYAPSASAVSAIANIAADLQRRAAALPGSFFWILDPVMGDEGRLYVAEDVIPAYKAAIRTAHLILPNQFEAETLSDVRIATLPDLAAAVAVMHTRHHAQHVVVTSLSFADNGPASLSVAGSSRTRDGTPRLFILRDIPKLPCFFSGTGDMFAALMVVRMREAALAAGLAETEAWMSGDEVEAVELPLARAVEMVIAGMAGVLEETMKSRDREMEAWEGRRRKEKDVNAGRESGFGTAGLVNGVDEEAKERHLAETKAAEVRVVRNVDLLRSPVVRFRAQKVVL